jgi:hypothetical protein
MPLGDTVLLALGNFRGKASNSLYRLAAVRIDLYRLMHIHMYVCLTISCSMEVRELRVEHAVN